MAQTKERLRKQIEQYIRENSGATAEQLAAGIIGIVRPEKLEVPPAVEAYCNAFSRYPDKDLWVSMSQAVGTDQAQIAKWEQHCQDWRMRGYRPNNYAGLFESFKSGTLKGNTNGNYQSSRPSRPAIGNEVSAEQRAALVGY